MLVREPTAVLAALAVLSPLTSVAQDSANRAPAQVVTEHMDRNQSVTVPAEMSKKGADVVLQMKDKTLKVANPSAVSSDVRQLPVEVVLSPDAEGQPQVQSIKLQATDAWEQKAPMLKSRYQEVTQAHVALDALAEKAYANEATPHDLDELARGVEVAQKSLVDAYKQLDDDARPGAARARRTASRAAKRKQGPVWSAPRRPLSARDLPEDLHNSRSAFALAVTAPRTPRCSAVLIGPDLALTNNHCLLNIIPAELEARFDFETDLDGHARDAAVFPVRAVRDLD